MPMAGDRNEQALARIEAAIARIDAAARRPAPVQTGGAELESLNSRHEKLRNAVGISLRQLDALIGETAR